MVHLVVEDGLRTPIFNLCHCHLQSTLFIVILNFLKEFDNNFITLIFRIFKSKLG